MPGKQELEPIDPRKRPQHDSGYNLPPGTEKSTKMGKGTSPVPWEVSATVGPFPASPPEHIDVDELFESQRGGE